VYRDLLGRRASGGGELCTGVKVLGLSGVANGHNSMDMAPMTLRAMVEIEGP